MTKEK